MPWNWQQADWPNFSYDGAKLAKLEDHLLYESGLLFGAFKHLDEGEQQALTVELISSEALKTSEIEGEYLDRRSVQSSIRRQFGLQTDATNASPAERGIVEMMTGVYDTFAARLTHKMLFDWHRALLQGRTGLKDVGGYRRHKDPMQIVSGAIHKPKVHFEAPPSHQVKVEMKGFIDWFNRTAPNKDQVLPPLARAGTVHLYFVSIHPFEDGNGRIGRALSEKALAQGLGQPTLISLSYRIEKQKKRYYDALAEANQSNEVTPWLVYFANTVLAAQRDTQLRIEFLIEKARFYERLRGQLNRRQAKVVARMLREGPDGFQGGLSADNYLSITKTSRATATRDLADLVKKGALYKTGTLKYTRYFLLLNDA